MIDYNRTHSYFFFLYKFARQTKVVTTLKVFWRLLFFSISIIYVIYNFFYLSPITAVTSLVLNDWNSVTPQQNLVVLWRLTKKVIMNKISNKYKTECKRFSNSSFQSNTTVYKQIYLNNWEKNKLNLNCKSKIRMLRSSNVNFSNIKTYWIPVKMNHFLFFNRYHYFFLINVIIKIIVIFITRHLEKVQHWNYFFLCVRFKNVFNYNCFFTVSVSRSYGF